MKTFSLLLAFALSSLSLAAHADKMGLPANSAPAYEAECGGCHVAFPPQLLAAEDWRRVMARLDKHYGDNASLDAPTRQGIEHLLVRHAGKPLQTHAGGMADKNAELPRVTATSWFKRKHHEVSRANWSHPNVKRPSNCAACHTRAAQGSYREREIVMPDGRRWED